MAVVSLVSPDNEQQLHNLSGYMQALLDPVGGISVFPGESVLLYVGQIWPAAPGLGVNPRPGLLAALIEAVQREGAGKITVAALAAPGFDFKYTWHAVGYEALDAYSILCCDLALAPKGSRQSPLNLACESLDIAEPLLKADYLINVSKLRSAEGKLFGSALNNLAAAADLPKQGEQAEFFSRALVDLHSIIAPDLHVLDALKGESGYQLQRAHALFAAHDAVALDTTVAALAGLTAGEIEYLALAAQYGLGCANASDIRLVGHDAMELFGY